MAEDKQQCRVCKEVKPIADYHLKGASYSYVCKACRDEQEKKRAEEEQKRQSERKKQSAQYQAEYQEEYRQQNAAAIREYQREYQKARYYRMKRTIGEPPVSLAGDHPKCPGCGGPTRRGGRTWISGVHVQRWQCKQCGFTFTKTWEEQNNGEE